MLFARSNTPFRLYYLRRWIHISGRASAHLRKMKSNNAIGIIIVCSKDNCINNHFVIKMNAPCAYLPSTFSSYKRQQQRWRWRRQWWWRRHVYGFEWENAIVNCIKCVSPLQMKKHPKIFHSFIKCNDNGWRWLIIVQTDKIHVFGMWMCVFCVRITMV